MAAAAANNVWLAFQDHACVNCISTRHANTAGSHSCQNCIWTTSLHQANVSKSDTAGSVPLGQGCRLGLPLVRIVRAAFPAIHLMVLW